MLTGSEEANAEEILAALSGWGLTLREEQAIRRRDQTIAFTVYCILPANPRGGLGSGAGPRAATEHAIR